jgi:hypothetical protein
MLRQKFGDMDRNATIGDLASKHGTPATGPSPAEASAADASIQPGGSSSVVEAQGKVARTRKGALDPQLRTALDYAAAASGVNVRVTSGGQRMHGAEGATGSHRHDKGRAADLDILDPKTGKVLALDDPRRLKFLEESAAAGAGGTGTRYMSDPSKVHVGITGNRAIVGEGLGAYAGPANERAAVSRGLQRMMTPAQVAAARKAQIGAGAAAPLSGYNAGVPGMGSGVGPTSGPGFGGAQDPNNPNQINVKFNVNDRDVQFARASMRREANREVREARWDSYSDIGSA